MFAPILPANLILLSVNARTWRSWIYVVSTYYWLIKPGSTYFVWAIFSGFRVSYQGLGYVGVV